MITTKEDIANRALRKIGANRIADIAATADKNAIIMNDLYDDSLRYCLSCGHWMFATKRALLEVDELANNQWTKYGLDNIYSVPSDFIRLIGWNISGAVVRQEGVYFLSDKPDLGIVYIYYNTTIAQYPPHFLEAFVDKLVLDCCYMITNSATKTQMLYEVAEASMSRALARDAMGQTQQAPICDAWLNARYSGEPMDATPRINYR